MHRAPPEAAPGVDHGSASRAASAGGIATGLVGLLETGPLGLQGLGGAPLRRKWLAGRTHQEIESPGGPGGCSNIGSFGLGSMLKHRSLGYHTASDAPWPLPWADVHATDATGHLNSCFACQSGWDRYDMV